MRKCVGVSLALLVVGLFACVPAAQAGFVRQGGPICTATGDQYNPVMASCPGGAIIAWEDHRSGAHVYAQKIDNYGHIKWALDGVGVSTTTTQQYVPSIASDGLGGAFIAWEDMDLSAETDIYVQHVDANGAPLWAVDGIAVCQAADNQMAPRVVADALGGCIVAWVDSRLGPQATDIYAQRVRSNGTVAWAANGGAICTASGNQQELRLVPDGKGGAIMAWTDYRSSGDIYAQKIRPNGSAAWTANGKAVCTASGVQQYPDMASDNHYGAVITWSDQRVTSDIYAQRIDSLGDGRWTANGLGVCVDFNFQNYPVVAVDFEGGAVVTWIDNRWGGMDCYAQRVGPGGDLKWTANGIAVCTATGYCESVGILPIFDKAVGIVWSDTRNGAADIYAQGVDSTGMTLLDDNGIALCDTVNAQNYPLGVSDGSGGAILAWSDFRSAYESDIYGARVDSHGQIVATLLQSCAAAPSANGVKVSWKLSEADDGLSFDILRATARDRAFIELDGRDISRDGMAFSFIDRSAEPGTSYVYRVDVSDENGRRVLFETTAVSMPSMPLALYQNSPNPFNPSTTIRFYLPERCVARLDVYDAAGTLVRGLADGVHERGTHALQWDGRDVAGNRVSSGVYFYTLKAGKESLSRKMVLVR